MPALIIDTVPHDQIGMAMGYINISTSMAMVLSPVLGGLVYERCGYTAVFAMAFGVIGLDLVLRVIMVEKHVARRTESTSNSPTALQQTTPQISVAARDPADAAHGSTVPASRTGAGPRSFAMFITSYSFLAALWGCCVQAVVLTAFDSVCPHFPAS